MRRRTLLVAGLIAPFSTAQAGRKTKRRKPKRLLSFDSYTTRMEVDRGRFRYSWDHRGRPISVEFQPAKGFVSSDALRHVMRNLRHSHNRDLMMAMAEEEPYRRSFIRPLVDAICSKAQRMRIDPVRLLLSFTQGMAYKPEGAYQSWPTEVLLTVHGDCSDTSVLFAALVEQYQATRVARVGRVPLWVYLYGIKDDRHMAVGVRPHAGIRYSGVNWRKKGHRYYFCETTGTGWDIGEKPKDTLLMARVAVPRSWKA